jgi:hypothetical protein
VCLRPEGYDPLVLDGAIPVLAGSGVRVFMFEYHGIGVWKDANVRLKVCCVDNVLRISHTPWFTHSKRADSDSSARRALIRKPIQPKAVSTAVRPPLRSGVVNPA